METLKTLTVFVLIALVFWGCGEVKKTTKTTSEDTETITPSAPQEDTIDLPDVPDINTAFVQIVYPRTAAETTDICNNLPFEKTYIKLDGSSDFLGMTGKLNKEQHYDADGLCDCLKASGATDKFAECIEAHKYIPPVHYPDNTNTALSQCNKSDGIIIMESHKIFEIFDFQFDGANADVCGMKDKLLAGQYGTYKNEGVCKCLNQYCGKTEQADEFIECIASYKNEE